MASVGGDMNIANADISELVIGEEMMHLRRLANATKAAASKSSKSSEGGGDDGGDGGDDNTEGAPDEKSMAGDEEAELEAKQGAPEITDEQRDAMDDAADSKTENDFAKKGLDTTEDFTDDMFKAVAKKGPRYIKKVKRYGAVSKTTFYSHLIRFIFLLGYGTTGTQSEIICECATSEKPREEKELRR